MKSYSGSATTASIAASMLGYCCIAATRSASTSPGSVVGIVICCIAKP